jgi:hypothetical protein
MFTFIRRPFESALSPWLGNDLRLFTLRLCNVDDCFDAHSLWDERYGGKKEIIEHSTGRSDLRLKAALDAHRGLTNEMDERRWLIRSERVFADVVVWLPEKEWQEDVEIGGKNLEVLVDNLANLHHEDFGSLLLCERLPSYVVMPDSGLALRNVMFQFGMGVFVPRAEDELIATVDVKWEEGGDWRPLPKWIFWEKGEQKSRQAAIFKGQQGLIFGASREFAAVRIQDEDGGPIWFDHGQGHIFVNYTLGAEKYAFGDGEHVSKGRILSQEEDGGRAIFAFDDKKHTASAPSPIGKRILVRVTPLRKKPATPEFSDEQPAPPREPRSVPTPVTLRREDREGKPGIVGPHLFLEGYGLPRLDVNKVAGLRGWILWFDGSGKPVNAPLSAPDEASQYLTLSAVANRNALFVRGPGKGNFTEVKGLPLRFKDENRVPYEIVVPPDDIYYLGILQIPKPELFIPLDRALVLGRSDPHPEHTPDVALDIFTNPQSLRWEEGRERHGAFLGALGLARRHVESVYREGNLEIVQLSKTSPVFGVMNDGGIERLEPDSSRKMVLRHGERLLLGCCLLRYEAGAPHAHNKDGGTWKGETLL